MISICDFTFFPDCIKFVNLICKYLYLKLFLPDVTSAVWQRSRDDCRQRRCRRRLRRRREHLRPSGIEDIAGEEDDDDEDDDDDEAAAAAECVAAAVASAASTAAAVSVCICANKSQPTGTNSSFDGGDCRLLDLSGSNSSVFNSCRICSGDVTAAAAAAAVAAVPVSAACNNSNADADSFTPRIRSDKKSVTVLLGK